VSDKSKIEWTDATWKSIRSARASASRLGGTASSRRSPNPKVAFFFKQWGGVRKKETGRELDGESYDEIPERRQTPVAVFTSSMKPLANSIIGSAATVTLDLHENPGDLGGANRKLIQHGVVRAGFDRHGGFLRQQQSF